MVYVDDYRAPFRGMRMSHMIADTDEELEEMARKLGLRPEWRQGDHYDVSEGKRAKAASLGAREVSVREMAKFAMRKRTKDGNGGWNE